jgi:hypothetical protein
MRKRSSRGPSDPPGNYEVGYRKPPRHTRFKSGQSGNPRGRPKTEKSLGAALNDALKAKVKLRGNGKERSVSSLDAYFSRVVVDALQGKASAQRLLAALMERFLPINAYAAPCRERRGPARRAFRRDRAHEETHAGKAAG